MTSALEIDGKSLLPIREAVQATTYSRDYVTRLAREKKIIATNVGRQWFVDVDSLKAYAEVSALEQEIRKRQLSAERIRERKIREAVEGRQALYKKQTKTLQVRSLAAACLVLGFGITGGLVAHSTLPLSEMVGGWWVHTQETSVAQVSRPTLDTASRSEIDRKSNLASVTETTISTAAEQSNNGGYEVHSLGEKRNGILLLPEATSTVADLFSDRVVVEKLSDGTQVVVRVDAAGNVVGRAVPFVNIPVNQTGQ